MKNLSGKNVRNMRIYDRYFRLIKSGVKTIEVRVAYSSMQKIKVGDVIQFNNDFDCRCCVLRIAHYDSFVLMMEKEDLVKINPNQSKKTQLSEIRRIFPPHKEKLGVIVFEFVLV